MIGICSMALLPFRLLRSPPLSRTHAISSQLKKWMDGDVVVFCYNFPDRKIVWPRAAEAEGSFKLDFSLDLPFPSYVSVAVGFPCFFPLIIRITTPSVASYQRIITFFF